MDKVYKGAIALFYKTQDNQKLYLVVENAETGNVTLVSGAFEEGDQTLEDTARREIKEELGIIDGYTLVPLNVHHQFVFGSKKKERAGHKGDYQVFGIDASHLYTATHTSELKNVKWMNKDTAATSFTFSDLKEVFEKAVTEMDVLREREQLSEKRTPMR